MSDSGDNVKFKWTPESTSLLVSVWSDRQVQKQLEYASKPQLIWESVARYMKKKGYNVSGKQCRSRMKQVLVCYREAKRAGTRAGVEQYYEAIDRVIKNKQLEEHSDNGFDTVDGVINIKSPSKEIKTNKNLQMRHKFQEPVQSLHRTEALSPTWTISLGDNEYPDSPESNETVINRPYRIFSPTRDVAINTGDQLAQMTAKGIPCDSAPLEEPVHMNSNQHLLFSYPYGEVPIQNTVQNVQNQIIQENMQQHLNSQQNRLWNQQGMAVNNLNFQQNCNYNQNLRARSANLPMQQNYISNQPIQVPPIHHVPQAHLNLIQEDRLQQPLLQNNRAMPQEPKKIIFNSNMTANHKQIYNSAHSDYSPDVSQNLNEAFCQSKSHNLNETYNQSTTAPLIPETSVITNNATCNDDSLLLELLIDSPTPSENDVKSKEAVVNMDNVPHVPLRKKKTQKLEQLVLSAINSQNEVVNKILAAQNDMVTKFLDIDRDRQNRLENRLDSLLKVVHDTVLTKQPETDNNEKVPPAYPQPIQITSLVPPPKPGTAPPKLDLVPPKPCRVPCTSSTVELINQNPVSTRPGMVSPVMSPVKKPYGTIWTKLGPVSQSPFVKAQQRLGFQGPSVVASETRTHSSAERKIAQELERNIISHETVIHETRKLIEAEKQLEEKIENAKLEIELSQGLNARRRLFTQREPTLAMILTAAFLENECKAEEAELKWRKTLNGGVREDDLLAGQGESYERLRRLSLREKAVPEEPCNTSTPAKVPTATYNCHNKQQTIQQLAQLVMNSARWRDPMQQSSNVQKPENPSKITCVSQPADHFQCMNPKYSENNPSTDQRILQNYQKPNLQIGFNRVAAAVGESRKKDYCGNEEGRDYKQHNSNNNWTDRKQQSVRFMDEALIELQKMYLERVSKEQQEKNDSIPYVTDRGQAIPVQSREMIEKYIQEIVQKGQKDTDSENDEEFLDTTTSMPTSIVPRRGSITSSGTSSTEYVHTVRFPKPDNCVVS